MTPVNRGVETPRATKILPPHIADWQLPPDWSWGPGGMVGDYRHYQEVNDALGRSLSLVTAPNPAHNDWLFEEARQLALAAIRRFQPHTTTGRSTGDVRRGPAIASLGNG